MAVHFHLNASSSSSSSPSNPPWRVFPLKTPIKLSKLIPTSKPLSLKVSSELSPSLHDPVIHQTESDTKGPEFFNPDGNSDPKTKSKLKPRSRSYVWVNPKSPRACQLRQKSYDARYPVLIGMAEALDSCNPELEDVSRVLVGLGSELAEQDAVTVLNNMSNPKTALIGLDYFLSKLESTRKVVLYNVTLKVLRKCRDLGSAEKVFDEMLQRGVKPDNVTFSTLITCARTCSLYEKAVSWFEKMGEFGCEPDVMTYSAMIDVYGRSGDVYKALSLYDRVRTERWRIDVVTCWEIDPS